MPEADGHHNDLHSGVKMITYTNEQAKEFTNYIANAQGAGVLHGWVTDVDPIKHARNVLTSYINAVDGDIVNVYDVGSGTGEMLYQLGEMYPLPIIGTGINLFPSQVEDIPPAFGITHCCGDFEKQEVPEWRKGLSDLVMCDYTLGHFDNLKLVIRKMWELTAPGGTLGLYDIVRRSILWDSIIGYHLWSQAEINDALLQAGFSQVNVWSKDYILNPLFTNDESKDGRKLVKTWEQRTCPILITAHKEM